MSMAATVLRFRSEDTDLSHESTIIQTNPRGDVIGIRFNNRSMQTFYVEPIGYTSSGQRHLQGCYADMDGLLSKLAVLERAVGRLVD